jgi:hypothetical protein
MIFAISIIAIAAIGFCVAWFIREIDEHDFPGGFPGGSMWG